jgi:multiple sugar transport system substrate-binding protein
VPALVLRGITWGHTRGYVPMVATAQRYNELHPDVRIDWHIRSLQSFADDSITTLSENYDLLVIDHPSIGEAAAHDIFIRLDNFLSQDFLQDQSNNSVGASHASYHIAGHQWALAIDSAAPVAASRPDILEANGLKEPATWDDMLELARAGLVALAGLPLDCLMHWYSLCINEGQTPFTAAGAIVDKEVGMAALAAIKELTTICGESSLTRNPIAAYELMTTSDSYGYSPLAYGYSNYARAGYSITSRSPLLFSSPPKRLGRSLCTTLGGAGLAVSGRCGGPTLDAALNYAQFVASGPIQTGLFTASGGQPGYRGAWLNAENNRITRNFFMRTLATLDCAYVRPRHERAIEFQKRATAVMDAHLRSRLSSREALEALNELDRQLRQPSSHAIEGTP